MNDRELELLIAKNAKIDRDILDKNTKIIKEIGAATAKSNPRVELPYRTRRVTVAEGAGAPRGKLRRTAR